MSPKDKDIDAPQGPLSAALGDIDDAADAASSPDVDNLDLEDAEQMSRLGRFRKGFAARVRGIKFPAVPRMKGVGQWATDHRKAIRNGALGGLALGVVGAGAYMQRDNISEFAGGVGEEDCIVTSTPAKGMTIPAWANGVVGDDLAVAVQKDAQGFNYYAYGMTGTNVTLEGGEKLTVTGDCKTPEGKEETEMTVDVSNVKVGETKVFKQ